MREKIMPKKLFSGTMLILLIFICSQAAFNRNTLFASASEPSNLKIYVGPPSKLACTAFHQHFRPTGIDRSID